MLKKCQMLFTDLGNDESGTFFIEYAMILSLIAMGIVGALQLLSTGIDTMFLNLANAFL